MSIVYLNNEFIDSSQARISVFDRGFLFGDSIYEVIPVYSGHSFRLSEHLRRLRSSLSAISISLGITDHQLIEIINKIIKSNPVQSNKAFAIYMQVTRGCDGTRNHHVSEHIEPTLFVSPTYPTKPSFGTGLNITTAEDIRWALCHIKATTLLPNIMINQESISQGYDDVILFRDEQLTEAIASNVFLVKGGTIFTPKKDTHILGGITRDFIIELAKKHGQKLVETDLTKRDVARADEVWLTSSNKEIAPVSTINGNIVSDGKPGPVWREMIGYYHSAIRALIQTKQQPVT